MQELLPTFDSFALNENDFGVRLPGLASNPMRFDRGSVTEPLDRRSSCKRPYTRPRTKTVTVFLGGPG